MEWIIAFVVIVLIVGFLVKFAYDHRKEEEELADLVSMIEERRMSQDDMAS